MNICVLKPRHRGQLTAAHERAAAPVQTVLAPWWAVGEGSRGGWGKTVGSPSAGTNQPPCLYIAYAGVGLTRFHCPLCSL